MLIRYQVLHPDSKMILKKSQMLYHVRVNTMILLISVKMNLRPVFKSEIHPTQNLPSTKIHFTPKVPRSEVSPYYKFNLHMSFLYIYVGRRLRPFAAVCDLVWGVCVLFAAVCGLLWGACVFACVMFCFCLWGLCRRYRVC